MKELTTSELTLVSGGSYGFVIGYLAGKAMDALFSAAAQHNNLFQNHSLALPYNRL
ncbi:MAG: bacteriocin-like protein [Glaciecola sp.]|jgi:bacteriocin-like protein